METKYQVAGAADADAVYAFAEKNFQPDADEMERTIALWNVAWRKEALAHYLSLGWSFKATRGTEICGFFIAQPFLFFRGATQTLWVESVLGDNDTVAQELCKIAIGIGREKHLQQVLFSESVSKENLSAWSPRAFADGVSVVATTKT